MSEEARLERVAGWIMQRHNIECLRGVAAELRDGTVCLEYYFSHPPNEEEMEEASCLSTEVVAAFSEEGLNVDYFTLTDEHPLPLDKKWVYQRSSR